MKHSAARPWEETKPNTMQAVLEPTFVSPEMARKDKNLDRSSVFCIIVMFVTIGKSGYSSGETSIFCQEVAKELQCCFRALQKLAY